MDSVSQSDEDWLLNIQRKLYQWSKVNPDSSYDDLWNWVTDSRNIRLAFKRVSSNAGRNTPGVDGITVRKIVNEIGSEDFLNSLRLNLREHRYEPSPARRKWIPKPGSPGKMRGLGIPTITDRVVQSAIKQIVEPIFEARFLHVSQGFRPGRAVRDAIELIRMTSRGRKRDATGRKVSLPYQWVIEGDIKGCFDNISHHGLMKRLRTAVGDRKVSRLINRFLKAGIMEGLDYYSTDAGTPQGGILSPLLANVALGVIEERYAKWVQAKGHEQTDKRGIVVAGYKRANDRKAGRTVFYPVRYADDFIILCSGSETDAQSERDALAQILKHELGLSLSSEKTKITQLTEGFNFLGFQIKFVVNKRWGWTFQARVPPDRQARLRQKIKTRTKMSTTRTSLKELIASINPIIRGWGNFYQHATGVRTIFAKMDYFIFERVFGWLEKKHKHAGRKYLYRKHQRRGGPRNWLSWQSENKRCVLLKELPRGPWNLQDRRLPHYMHATGKPGA